MSRKARDAMVKLREVSMRLGGAQYVKKRSNEAVPCEVFILSSYLKLLV